LKNHAAYSDKVSPMQKLNGYWVSDIKLLLENKE